ncbi:MAG: flavin monoamine oxidase family protein [Thermoleophilaceae bacterium]
MVVGAGIAGVVAAHDLVAASVPTIVLEARNRVGGRALDVPIADDKVVELGAQWIGPAHEAVGELANSLGLETHATYDIGESVTELGGLLSRRAGQESRHRPIAAEAARIDLDRLAHEVPLEAPWEAARGREWDGQTLWSWIERNVADERARKLLRLEAVGVWGTDPTELSLLHALFEIRSAGSFEAMTSVRGGAQESRLTAGAQALPRRLAERLGERVMLSTPVRMIARESGGAIVSGDEMTVRCQRVIVALPPPLAAFIDHQPPLPAAREELNRRMRLGAVIKVAAVYDEPFWRSAGLSGQALSDRGPVSETVDSSPADGSPGVLTAFVAGGNARLLGVEPAAKRRREILASLGRLFGARAANPDRYLEVAWAEEEWTRGAYAGYFGPGGWTRFGHALRRPVGRLHWAGAETSTVWAGYIDGAVRSGHRAAAEVLRCLD